MLTVKDDRYDVTSFFPKLQETEKFYTKIIHFENGSSQT
jgi:hypothetical protein